MFKYHGYSGDCPNPPVGKQPCPANHVRMKAERGPNAECQYCGYRPVQPHDPFVELHNYLMRINADKIAFKLLEEIKEKFRKASAPVAQEPEDKNP